MGRSFPSRSRCWFGPLNLQPRPGRRWAERAGAKTLTGNLAAGRHLRSLDPAQVRIAHRVRRLLPHLPTNKCRRIADWSQADSVEIAYAPADSSWLNHIEAQSTVLDGTGHPPAKPKAA